MSTNESNAVESNSTASSNEAPPVNRPEVQIRVNYRGVDAVGNLQFAPTVSNGERENVLSELRRIGSQAGRITGAIFTFSMVTPEPVPPAPPAFALTDDEKESLVALREGKAKLVFAKPTKPAKPAKEPKEPKAKKPAKEPKAKPAKPAKKPAKSSKAKAK